MRKRKYLLVSSLLFLITSCGSKITAESIDPEVLSASVNVLNSRSSDAAGSYYNYIQEVNERYGDSYLASSDVKVASPKSYDIANELTDASKARENHSYAQVAIASDTVSYSFSDLKLGRYQLVLEYYIPESFASNPLISIDLNGESLFSETSNIVLPLKFEDDIEMVEGKKNFDSYTTKYGDQMSPTQKRVMEWQEEGLYESTFSTSEPLVFEVTNKNTVVTLTNLSDDYFYVGKLTLKPVVKDKTYNEYYSEHASSLGTDDIECNAIEYSYKNTNDMTLSNEQTPAATPYDDERKLLNVTSGWDQSGQSISWVVNVKSAGYYPITLHYYNDNENFPLFRKIEINGEVPFAEVANYKFPTTGSNYLNKQIEDENGNPYYFYLESGDNTITLTASTEPVLEVYTNLMAVYDDINDFAIDIRKITGSTVDTYHTYKLTKYFSETVSVLKAYKNVIKDSYYKLHELVGNDKSSGVLSYFQRMEELIDEFIEEPDDLPLNLSKFSSGDSCLAKLIADTATTLQSTCMVLDTMYVTNNESSIRDANASWISSFYSSLVTLGQTFSSDKYKTILHDGELNVWSARSQAYNDILQTFADNYFTPNTVSAEYPEGIKVNIRQMPSEDNLIYAYSANTVPDLVLGINSGRAFEFALRGDAAYPMSDFDETWKYTNNNHWNFTPYFWDVASNMPHGQLMSMLYNDKIYSLPESTGVELLFARDDIMNVIGDNGTALNIPDTWKELIGELYRIQSYGMNFYYPTSASGSLKALSNTAQFILQNNGSILSSDGYTTDLRSDETYEGLKLLTDLYTIYALPTEVGSFYNHFRYGTYPLGIGDLGMYLSLKYVAPELLGKWSVHQIPGIAQEKQSDGTYADLNNDGVGDEVSRWYISNGSSAMIFNNSKLIDEAWLFLQWWMSEEIQVMFTESLQSTYGPSVVWFSANLDAAESLPIDSTVRDVVLEQVKWIVDLQQIPGQYMLERGLSDIWNTVVFGTSSSGESTGKVTIGEAIDLEKVLIDREVQRKMEEFGYYDTSSGQGTRDYILRNFSWVEACFENHKNGTKGGNTSTPVCPL